MLLEQGATAEALREVEEALATRACFDKLSTNVLDRPWLSAQSR